VRWAWAEVDLGAIRHNVATIAALVAPAEVWAVVKADGYGHGVIPVTTAALAAGATGLCVAMVQEGVELRVAGIDAPILVLSEQPPEQAEAMVAASLTATLYTAAGIEAFATAVGRTGGIATPVHLKFDTGMHRVGAAPSDAAALIADVMARPELRLAGVFTHLAKAGSPNAADNELQLRRFDDVLEAVAAAGVSPVIHAANSAAALALPEARRDLVRLGIAMYGIEPGPDISDLCGELRPALSLHARVSFVKRVAPGEGISYGLLHRVEAETTIATVPIGYADGVPRLLFAGGGEVLIHGRRIPIVGVVTMDSLMVDCGDHEVAVGDEVVLIGGQVGAAGSDAIPAEEWAARLGTIGYEIVCGISRRIERRHIEP
jgi:alanine racemase